MRITSWVYAIVLWCGLFCLPAHAAGLQLLDTDPALKGAIWYPCAAPPQDVALGRLAADWSPTLLGVKDCPLTAGHLPLIIVSHGRGAWFGVHHDTAEALADAGFVVAAINHPGDSFGDAELRDSFSVWASRPADVVRLLDFVLHDWKDKAAIDPARIGLFGFSKGGYTGLIVAGATLDFARFASFCTDVSKTCEQVRGGDVPHDLKHDDRIKAAVVADPAPSVAFTRATLASIHIPLQVWRSEQGAKSVGVDPEGVNRVMHSLPGEPELHIVPAGHWVFLAPCTPEVAANLPRYCDDPPGFDRVAFHREFDANVVRFFREKLGSDGGAR